HRIGVGVKLGRVSVRALFDGHDCGCCGHVVLRLVKVVGLGNHFPTSCCTVEACTACGPENTLDATAAQTSTATATAKQTTPNVGALAIRFTVRNGVGSFGSSSQGRTSSAPVTSATKRGLSRMASITWS